jgi:uncharacterized membrane protein YcjF (UPF0283 family)
MAEIAKIRQKAWSRDLANLRRPTANPIAENETDDSAVDPEESGRRSQKGRLNFLRKKASEKTGAEGTDVIKQQAEEKIKKEIAQKLTWRAANMAMGASIILIFLTILVWTVQFIGGNLMDSKMIPKLSLGETILWIIGLCIIFALIDLILLVIIMAAQVFKDPIGLITVFGKVILEVFWGAIKTVTTGS